jgi:hypothetical protein
VISRLKSCWNDDCNKGDYYHSGGNQVSANELLKIDREEKALLWEVFHYEKMLDDSEEILLSDLNHYEERIRSIGGAKTAIEIGLLTIYMKHIKNIRTLLLNLQNNRNDKLKKQIQDLSIKSPDT